MNLVICMAFGAGVAGFVYSKFGRRVGYGNSSNIAIILGVVFIISSIFFYTIMSLTGLTD